MTGERAYRTLVFLLCVTQVLMPGMARASTRGAQPDFPGAGARLGIARLGEFSSASAERAYGLFEKRFQRWFENRDGWSLQIEPVAHAVSPESIQIERVRAELGKQLAQCVHAWTRPVTARDQASALSAEPACDVEALRSSLKLLGEAPDNLPLIQRGRFAEAVVHFLEGRKVEAESALRIAYRLHPEGQLPSLWDLDAPTTALASFDAFATAAVARETRACHLSIETPEPDAVLTINGFELGKRRAISVPVPGVFHLEVTSPQGRATERVVCRAASRHVVRPVPTARQLAAMPSARPGSLFLVEPKGEELKLYLYTPDVSIDEVPLSRPLRVAEVLSSPGGLPVATDALAGLLEKHQLMSPARVGGESASTEAVVGRSDTRWYNSTVFWLVVGGVAAGVVGALVLSNGSNVQNQPHPAVSISLE